MKNPAQNNKTQKPKAGYRIQDLSTNMECLPELEDADYTGCEKLTGKVAMVTGADSGIGAAAALAFIKEGAKVAILYLDEQQDADRILARIKALGGEAIGIKGDIGSEKFCQRAVDKVIKTFGRLDILVNNAGEQHPCESITEITQSQLERTFRTNLFGMFYMVKAALPVMEKSGAIINTTSETAYHGSGGLLDYSASKGAIVSFTRSLSLNKEITAKKIRVNAISPGPIWTPLIPATFEESHVKKFGKDVPMKRPGQPAELAPAYVYLACHDSSYMAGQVLHLSGGMIVNG